MKSQFYIPVIFCFVLLSSCKSSDQSTSQQNSNSSNLIALLAEGVSPGDVNMLSAVDKENVKRVSRSQNLWMIKLSDQKSAADLKSKLEQDDRVIEVSFEGELKTESTKNSKSGKAGPINNN